MFKFVPRKIEERKINAPISKEKELEILRFQKISEKLNFIVEKWDISSDLLMYDDTGIRREYDIRKDEFIYTVKFQNEDIISINRITAQRISMYRLNNKVNKDYYGF